MQIVEIAEENLDSYLVAGFLQFDPETGKSIDQSVWEDDLVDLDDDAEDAKPTATEARNYLLNIGVRFAPNTGDAKLIQKALDNGWSAQPASKEINDDGLDALNDLDDAEDATANVDTDTAEDLGDLADVDGDEDAEDADDAQDAETAEDAEDASDAEDATA